MIVVFACSRYSLRKIVTCIISKYWIVPSYSRKNIFLCSGDHFEIRMCDRSSISPKAQTFIVFVDSNPKGRLLDARFGASVSLVTFYCLWNDGGRIFHGFWLALNCLINDTLETSNRNRFCTDLLPGTLKWLKLHRSTESDHPKAASSPFTIFQTMIILSSNAALSAKSVRWSRTLLKARNITEM